MSTNAAPDPLLDHEYDGIREYDNPLPSWWNWIFLGSFLFSIAYVFWFHLGEGPTVHDQYEGQVAAHVEALLDQLGEIEPNDATIVEFMGKDDWMSAMGGVFRGNCAQCHSADGGGGIGPNLTDDSYKNVKRPEDLFTVISDGITGTSMPPWKDRLREPQMILLAAYVAKLRGTTPANPKAAEGNPIDPWPAPEPAAEPTETASLGAGG